MESIESIENSDGVTFARVMDIIGPTHMRPVVFWWTMERY